MMYCTNCGNPRPDDATVCASCGTAVASFAGQQRIPNYLVQAILVTLCCCLPGGIMAIIFSAQVNSKLAQGDIAGAEAASRNARLWCWISLIGGLLIAASSGLWVGLGLNQKM